METETDQKLYEDSVKDAMVAEEDEIEPVIAITKDSKDVIWKNSTNTGINVYIEWFPRCVSRKRRGRVKEWRSMGVFCQGNDRMVSKK